jgi:predicted ArsR family transcriptional regulator
MPLTTRLKILDYLKRHDAASVGELSRWLSMSGANIRHHLTILERSELVEMIGQQREGRGRPKNIFRLSRRVLGDSLDVLSSALLDGWINPLSEESRETELMKVAEILGAAFEAVRTGPATKRIIAMVKFLNQLHYQARWEATAGGARLVLGHCPFSAIIERHPELCRLDAHLLEYCSLQKVDQVAKLEPTGQGSPQCIFIIL